MRRSEVWQERVDNGKFHRHDGSGQPKATTDREERVILRAVKATDSSRTTIDPQTSIHHAYSQTAERAKFTLVLNVMLSTTHACTLLSQIIVVLGSTRLEWPWLERYSFWRWIHFPIVSWLPTNCVSKRPNETKQLLIFQTAQAFNKGLWFGVLFPLISGPLLSSCEVHIVHSGTSTTCLATVPFAVPWA